MERQVKGEEASVTKGSHGQQGEAQKCKNEAFASKLRFSTSAVSESRLQRYLPTTNERSQDVRPALSSVRLTEDSLHNRRPHVDYVAGRRTPSVQDLWLSKLRRAPNDLVVKDRCV